MKIKISIFTVVMLFLSFFTIIAYAYQDTKSPESKIILEKGEFHDGKYADGKLYKITVITTPTVTTTTKELISNNVPGYLFNTAPEKIQQLVIGEIDEIKKEGLQHMVDTRISFPIKYRYVYIDSLTTYSNGEYEHEYTPIYFEKEESSSWLMTVFVIVIPIIGVFFLNRDIVRYKKVNKRKMVDIIISTFLMFLIPLTASVFGLVASFLSSIVITAIVITLSYYFVYKKEDDGNTSPWLILSGIGYGVIGLSLFVTIVLSAHEGKNYMVDIILPYMTIVLSSEFAFMIFFIVLLRIRQKRRSSRKVVATAT